MRASLAQLARLLLFLVGALERHPVEADLGFELAAAVAVPPVEVPELALGRLEFLARALALQVEPFPLLGDEADGRVASVLVLFEGEWLDRRTFEGAGGPFRRRRRVGFA